MDVVDKYLRLMPDEVLKDLLSTAIARLETTAAGSASRASCVQAASLFSKEICRRADLQKK